jgi:hypothetical protein
VPPRIGARDKFLDSIFKWYLENTPIKQSRNNLSADTQFYGSNSNLDDSAGGKMHGARMKKAEEMQAFFRFKRQWICVPLLRNYLHV